MIKNTLLLLASIYVSGCALAIPESNYVPKQPAVVSIQAQRVAGNKFKPCDVPRHACTAEKPICDYVDQISASTTKVICVTNSGAVDALGAITANASKGPYLPR